MQLDNDLLTLWLKAPVGRDRFRELLDELQHLRNEVVRVKKETDDEQEAAWGEEVANLHERIGELEDENTALRERLDMYMAEAGDVKWNGEYGQP